MTLSFGKQRERFPFYLIKQKTYNCVLHNIYYIIHSKLGSHSHINLLSILLIAGGRYETLSSSLSHSSPDVMSSSLGSEYSKSLTRRACQSMVSSITFCFSSFSPEEREGSINVRIST